MRKKRFLAVILSASMVLGSTVVSYGATYPFPTENVKDETAASGNMTGDLHYEGTVSEDVFSVDLPTKGYNDDVFDFILDPQELIYKTDALRYDKNSGITNGQPANNMLINSASQNFERSTLYFVNCISDNTSSTPKVSANRLSASSDALTIVNKSAIDVDVALTANVSGMDKVDMVSTNADATGAETASIYLALQGSASSNVATADTIVPIMKGNGASIQTQISGNDDAYIISVNKTNGKYEKVLSENSTGFEEYSFSLTGACGGEIKNWQTIENEFVSANPKVDVVWNIKPHQDVVDAAPSLAQDTYQVTSGTPLNVTVDLGSGALAATSIAKILQPNGAELPTPSMWTSNGNTLTFTAAAVNVVKSSMTLKIVFDDAAATELSITLHP